MVWIEQAESTEPWIPPGDRRRLGQQLERLAPRLDQHVADRAQVQTQIVADVEHQTSRRLLLEPHVVLLGRVRRDDSQPAVERSEVAEAALDIAAAPGEDEVAAVQSGIDDENLLH